MDKFRQSSSTNIIPTLASFWDDFYQGDVGREGRPTTMLHVKDIAHQLTAQFNQFDAFVRERDEFLIEVDRYLAAQVSQSCYKAWQVQMANCNDTAQRYMLDLLGFAHNMQWFLIRKPLTGVRSQLCNAQFAQYLHSLRHDRTAIQIDQEAYRKSLQQLNEYRDDYCSRWNQARENLRDTIQSHAAESRRTSKSLGTFLCLHHVMLDPGRKATVRTISPEDFPLPDIAKVRDRWYAYDGQAA